MCIILLYVHYVCVCVYFGLESTCVCWCMMCILLGIYVHTLCVCASVCVYISFHFDLGIYVCVCVGECVMCIYILLVFTFGVDLCVSVCECTVYFSLLGSQCVCALDFIVCECKCV